MVDGFQYNEGYVIDEFFGSKDDLSRQKFIVEVGAADGVDNSNSLELIQRGWLAFLIEPHPEYFRSLVKRYATNPRVKLSHYAISNVIGWKNLYLNGQCSSVVYVNGNYVAIQCTTLSDIFELYSVPQTIDLLSVDVEGHDLAVLSGLDLKKYSVRLICVEHSMGKEVLDTFMAERGYKLFDRTMGNSFYEKASS